MSNVLRMSNVMRMSNSDVPTQEGSLSRKIEAIPHLASVG